jgi:hypothetical protein
MPRPIIVAYAPDTTARPPTLPSPASELLSLLVAGVQRIAHAAQPQGVEHWSSDEFIGSRPDVNGLIATALLKPLHEHVGSKPREAGKDSERDNPEVLELPAEKRWQLKRSHLELLDVIIGDLRFNGAPSKALAKLRRLELLAKERPSAWFEKPENFKAATDLALSTQKAAFASLGSEEVWVSDRLRENDDDDRRRLARRSSADGSVPALDAARAKTDGAASPRTDGATTPRRSSFWGFGK